MPDNRCKRPLPAVMNVGTFRERFGTDEGCWEHLRNTRWGPNLEQFICPDCGHARGWWLAIRRLVECSECHRQTSVMAGTVFHGARVPLWKWFWAIYQLAQGKKGIAALTLAKQIGVCYGTAWLMLLKLRRAMRRRNERYVLQGLVEVDETYVGGEEPGHRGRPGPDSQKKVPVAVALELNDEGKPRRVAMASVKRVTGHHLKRFAVLQTAVKTRASKLHWGVAIFVGAVEIIAPHFIALGRARWHHTVMDVVMIPLRRRLPHGSRRADASNERTFRRRVFQGPESVGRCARWALDRGQRNGLPRRGPDRGS